MVVGTCICLLGKRERGAKTFTKVFSELEKQQGILVSAPIVVLCSNTCFVVGGGDWHAV